MCHTTNPAVMRHTTNPAVMRHTTNPAVMVAVSYCLTVMRHTTNPAVVVAVSYCLTARHSGCATLPCCQTYRLVKIAVLQSRFRLCRRHDCRYEREGGLGG